LTAQLPTLSAVRHQLPTRRTAQVLPAAAGLLYAGVQLDGGIVAAAYRDLSTVSTDRLNYPYAGTLATATSLTWAATQALFIMTLVAFARCAAVGSSRSGRLGAKIAAAGGVIFTAAHLTSAIYRDTDVSDTAGTIAVVLFLAASLCTAGGFLAAGLATMRAARWTEWRRLAPLAVGVWMACLIPLQFTPLLPGAVAIYALTVAAFSIALLCEDDSISQSPFDVPAS
jgi:hypothetical protein